MNRKAIVAVDLGTTHLKAIVRSVVDGTVLGQCQEEVTLLTPEPDAVEIDPIALWEGFTKIINDSLAIAKSQDQECSGDVLVFSAAMHSLMVVDPSGTPKTAVMTWADRRAASEAAALRGTTLGNDWHRRTGTPIHAMSPAMKVLWLKHQKPEIWNERYLYVGAKDWLIYKLTGKWLADTSLASATGLYALQSGTWDPEALQYCDLLEHQLPPLASSLTKLTVDKIIAQQLGLATNAEIVLGASDGVLANLGSGAILPGQCAVTVGTSGAIRQVVRQPLAEAIPKLFCYHLAADRWVVGGAINNGGISLAWLQKAVADDLTLAQLMEVVERAKPGAKGLICLPLWLGERAPHWNEAARGSWIGLDYEHRRAELLRSAVEGVIYRLRTILEGVQEASHVENMVVRVSGGFFREKFTRQLFADICNVSVVLTDDQDASIHGAYLLARIAYGWSNWADAETNTPQETYTPDAKTRELYDQGYVLFQACYDGVAPMFGQIAGYRKASTLMDKIEGDHNDRS